MDWSTKIHQWIHFVFTQNIWLPIWPVPNPSKTIWVPFSCIINHLGLLMLRALPLTMRHFPAQKLPVTRRFSIVYVTFVTSLVTLAQFSKWLLLYLIMVSYAKATSRHPTLRLLVPAATQPAPTWHSSPLALWSGSNGPKFTRPQVSRPSSPSPACRAIAPTRWQHSCVCCASSPPATQLTHCCYCLACALSPAATSRGPSAVFSQPLDSLRMRIHCIAGAAVGQQPRCARVLISWMWNAMACGRAMPSGST